MTPRPAPTPLPTELGGSAASAASEQRGRDVRAPAAPPGRRGVSSSWRFEEGEELVPGRHVIGRLGGGHRYETYLAWDDRMRALVVVKAVRPHLVEHAHTLAGLEREAMMLERLRHPVILRGFDSEFEGERPHLVLEHLEGPRLSTLVRRYGPLPLEQLLPLGLQLCSALHYLSTEAVVHLDVKPSNIIMGAPARLIDLSVALELRAAEALDHPVGTDGYMAPEQCDPLGRGGVGVAADVWGLGVTLYKAATGVRPFSRAGADRASPQECWPQLVEAARPLEVPLPETVSSTIMSCLVPEPAERPRPDEIADTLEPILDAMPGPRLARLKPRLR
jgi:eukaryotic-like serine/threonine-protein kinase